MSWVFRCLRASGGDRRDAMLVNTDDCVPVGAMLALAWL